MTTPFGMPTFVKVGKKKTPKQLGAPATPRPPTEAGPITIGTNCATFTDSNVQTFTWPIPSDAKVGDLCFQFIHTYDDQVGSVPSGWTQGWAVNANVTHDYGYMYYKVLETADLEGNLTFQLDATGEAALLSLFARGEGITFADVTVAGPAGMDTAEHDPPAVTPTQGAGDYYVLVVFQNNKGSFTTSFAASGPTGYDAKCEIASASPKVHVWQATKSIVTSENPSEIDWTDTAGSRKYATATIAIPVQFEDGDVAAGNHTHVEADVTDLAHLQNINDANDVGTGANTKGDLLVFDGTDYERIGVGSNDQVLTADSAQTLGVKWAASAGGGGSSTKSYVTEPGMRPPDSSATGDIEFQSHANGTDPTVGPGLTWGNQGSASAAINNGFLIMNSATTTGLRALLKATPSTGNFQMDTMAQSHQWLDTQWAGLVMLWGTPGTPTAIRAAGFYRNDSVVEDHRFVYTTLNTSWAATADDASQNMNIAGDRVYLRIEWDGTNLIYKTSPNGLVGTYYQVTSQAEGLGRPDYVGMGVNTNGAAAASIAAFSFLRFNWAADFDPTTDV